MPLSLVARVPSRLGKKEGSRRMAAIALHIDDHQAATAASLVWGFEYEIERDGRDVLVSLHGELDLATADMLDDIAQAVTYGGGGALLVDLQGVTFLDVAAGRALLRCYELMQQRYRTVTFAGMQSTVWTVLRVTGLDHLLPVGDGRLYGFTARARHGPLTAGAGIGQE
jgi:anti-sigma B factor antagonist